MERQWFLESVAADGSHMTYNITQRQVYPQTASEGGTVFDSKNADALAEMNALADEVLAFINAERA